MAEENTCQEGKLRRANFYSETNTFDFPLVHVDPEKGIQVINYQESLNQCVKPTLRIVYDQLMENMSGLDGEAIDPAMIDDLLSTFRTALVMWEQIDQKVADDMVSRFMAARDQILHENKEKKNESSNIEISS